MDEALELAFDENAETYDRVNGVISLGLDSRWREWAARQAVREPGDRVLDAFAGTGRVGIAAAKLGGRITLADDSPEMLRVASERVRAAGIGAAIVQTDLADNPLPFASASFDAITVVFGVRYLDEPVGVLTRLASLLAAQGRMVILEFVVPRRSVISALASAYFFRVIPKVAPLLGGRSHLHDTLARTTMSLGPAENLESICERAGLEITERETMGFGLVSGLVCRRRS